MVAGLARIPHVRAHVDHIAEDGLGFSARALVDENPTCLNTIINALSVRFDDPAPDVRRQKQAILCALIVPVPNHVQLSLWWLLNVSGRDFSLKQPCGSHDANRPEWEQQRRVEQSLTRPCNQQQADQVFDRCLDVDGRG